MFDVSVLLFLGLHLHIDSSECCDIPFPIQNKQVLQETGVVCLCSGTKDNCVNAGEGGCECDMHTVVDFVQMY